MLILRRKVGEKIVIGEGIVVVVTRVSGARVTLGIEAPAAVHIVRGELRAFDETHETSDQVSVPAPIEMGSAAGHAIASVGGSAFAPLGRRTCPAVPRVASIVGRSPLTKLAAASIVRVCRLAGCSESFVRKELRDVVRPAGRESFGG